MSQRSFWMAPAISAAFKGPLTSEYEAWERTHAAIIEKARERRTLCCDGLPLQSKFCVSARWFMTRGRTRSWEIHLECVPCGSEGLTLWGSKAKEGNGGGGSEACETRGDLLRSTLKADVRKSPCQTAETFSHVSRHRRLYYPTRITPENRSKQLNGCCQLQITHCFEGGGGFLYY